MDAFLLAFKLDSVYLWGWGASRSPNHAESSLTQVKASIMLLYLCCKSVNEMIPTYIEHDLIPL